MYRRCLAVLLAALAVMLCAGCTGQTDPGSGDLSSPPPAETSAPEGQEQPIELTPEHKERYASYLWPLAEDGQLMNQEPLSPGFIYDTVKEIDVVEALLGQESLILTAELYGSVMLDLATGKDFIPDGFGPWDGAVEIRSPADAPHAPYILLGTSTVELRDQGRGPEVLSCHWQPLESPGRRVLEETSAQYAEQIAASQKPDLSGYDQRLVDYVYRIIASQRLIGGPEEITLWDLENLCTDISIDYDPLGEDFVSAPTPLDAGLLRLIPGLRTVMLRYPLEDYSVFEGMTQLESLEIIQVNTEQTSLDLSTLRIGQTRVLHITFCKDISLDLSDCQVDTMEISSWSAAVTGLRGCDGIRELEFIHTRSDTRIINAETFPDLEVLRMEFFSDYPRVRDLSQLATFGKDVTIDLTLRYQACNNKTVESLAGVRLNDLTLCPNDGQWPLDEPDPRLVEQIDAENVVWVE